MSRIGVILKINKNQEGVANSSNQGQYRLSGFQFLPMTVGALAGSPSISDRCHLRSLLETYLIRLLRSGFFIK